MEPIGAALDAPTMLIAVVFNTLANGYAMAPMRANQPNSSGPRDFISARLNTMATVETKTAPATTVKKVAVGGETRCVPNRIRMLPMEKPAAATKANRTAKDKNTYLEQICRPEKTKKTNSTICLLIPLVTTCQNLLAQIEDSCKVAAGDEGSFIVRHEIGMQINAIEVLSVGGCPLSPRHIRAPYQHFSTEVLVYGFD